MAIQDEIINELKGQGADIIRFVNISGLSAEQNKGFPNAILFGILLSPGFILEVTNTPDYVQNLVKAKRTGEDEFNRKEKKTDALADHIAGYISKKGYSAYSQSEANIEATGFYNRETKSTPLPHKTIAVLAGLGWIGRHNLLVTPDYGSAISMCTVLTDAALDAGLHAVQDPLCGPCSICRDQCPTDALKGVNWDKGISRNEIVDVNKCTTCLQCLALCPWTQRYMRKNL